MTFRSDDLGELFAALSAFQGEVVNVQKDGLNPHFRNRYTTLDALQQATRPLLASHGLCITQLVGGGDGVVTVRTILGHRSGQWVASECSAEVSVEKGLKIAQVMGSVVSYLRRYAWQAALGVASTDDDDDATSAPTRRDPTLPTRPEPSPEPEPEADTFRRQLFATLPKSPTLASCNGDKAAWEASKARYQAAAKMLLRQWYGVGSSKEITADHAAGPFGRNWLSDPSNVSLSWDDFWSAAADAAEGGA